MAIIEVKNLTKSFVDGKEKNIIFQDISFSIEEKQFIVIIGKSGAGKSTLLNIMGGLEETDFGQVIINGQDICSLNDTQLSKFRAQDMGYVFQDFNLLPVLSVWDNILLPLKISKVTPDLAYIEEVMKMLEIDEKKNVLPDTLSGGQKQRVAIARALASKPAIIMADEPTGNLDGATGQKVLELLIDGIRKYHQTLVMVTHDMDIAKMADRVIEIGR